MLGFLKARKGLRLRGYVGAPEGAAVVVVVVALGSMEDVFDAICTGSAADCMAPVMIEGGKRVKKRRSLGWRSWARRICFCVAAMLGVYVRLSVVYPHLFEDFDIDARLGSLAARDGPTLMVARVRAAASRCMERATPPPPNSTTQIRHHQYLRHLLQLTATTSGYHANSDLHPIGQIHCHSSDRLT